MKGVFSAPGDYIYFKSQVPLHKIPIGSKQWRYYDFGPKVVPRSYVFQGYRVISVDIPRVWNHQEWIQAFEKFWMLLMFIMCMTHAKRCAFPSKARFVVISDDISPDTSLRYIPWGLSSSTFAQHRPRRVKSLVLSNTFLETSSFSAAMPWAPVVGWSPSFLLKRYILTGIHGGPHEPFIADSVDFVVAQVETLSKDDLASRLSLTVNVASVGPLLLSDSSITLMDTNDFCAIPQQLKDQVTERYPGARQAYLKSGGDFPFLSRPDEVNLHLQLHLRRVGVEARPDMVPGLPKDDPGGSSSDQNDKRGNRDDAPEDDKEDHGGPTNTSEPPLVPGGPDSGNFREPAPQQHSSI